MQTCYLAVDIGASSGRPIIGHMENGKMILEEIYRFENGMVKKDGELCWEFDRLFNEIVNGLKKCKEIGKIPVSMGVDTWGVDFVLLDKDDKVLGNTVGYRDHRTEGMDEEVYKTISLKDLYARTGIQKAIYNTVYQLMAVKKKHPEYLEQAETLLHVPDYFHFLLTGEKTCEYTEATTGQLLCPTTKDGDYELIDSVKKVTNVDITLFYQDIRVATTLENHKGERVVGTQVSPVVKRDVLDKADDMFYSSVMVEDERYFAYYAPLFAEDGSCIGMIFVAQPSANVEKLIRNSIMPMVVIAILVMILVAFVTIHYTTGLVDTIKKIETYMANIAKGHLHDALDYEVLKRDDELGEMGRNAVRMQKSLRELVEEDTLTGLNNRRCGEKKLHQTYEDYAKRGISYCVALGDIDFFKRVNDTYGHDCGDVVLTEIAKRLKYFMRGKGYAVRWGGEEFLLVFPEFHIDEAEEVMNEFIHELDAHSVSYKEETEVHITMTFGIVEAGEQFANIDSMVSGADRRLYIGKQNGRNQIVAEEQSEQDL